MLNYYQKKYTDNFFDISSEHGFIPIKPPLTTLPNNYIKLQYLINDLPNVLNIPNEIEKRVLEIPDYSDLVKLEQDVFIIQALFRTYTFVTSAYTLELSYQDKSNKYGKARKILPANIAKPLVIVSDKLNINPWLNYYYSSFIGNYIKKSDMNNNNNDNNDNNDWKNINMICNFLGTNDEIQYKIINIHQNKLSPILVKNIMDFGKIKLEENENSKNNEYIKILDSIGNTMIEMRLRRDKILWSIKYDNFYKFRYNFKLFDLEDTSNNYLFDEGLIYEGCYDNKPQKFDNIQSATIDNIMPMIEIFSGIVNYYSEDYFNLFFYKCRNNKPICMDNFFIDLQKYYKENPILETLKQDNNVDAMIKLLVIVNQIFIYRNYIWLNIKYKFKPNKHNNDVNWQINRLEYILNYEFIIIDEINKYLNNDIKCDLNVFYKLKKKHKIKIGYLKSSVDELNKNSFDIKLIYPENIEKNYDANKIYILFDEY